MNEEKKFWHPMIGGFLLGTLLFISFMVAGQGLGASGAFARVTAQLAYLYDAAFSANGYAGAYLKHGSALANWTVVEVVGVFIGGYLSAAMAGRIKQSIERGDNYPAYKRLFWAFLGGFLIAPATRLARGCTSGQALDGAASFSVGAWIFMIAAFGAGFLLAPLFKKQWQ
ncbi:MAG: YeeE/YedE thiosulfate transporter family protein [Sulfurospirillaceae bacterium]|nr:YeeE/YedE thiosulfate transporter family protein [Sulfurospirillaceae bacterium]